MWWILFKILLIILKWEIHVIFRWFTKKNLPSSTGSTLVESGEGCSVSSNSICLTVFSCCHSLDECTLWVCYLIIYLKQCICDCSAESFSNPLFSWLNFCCSGLKNHIVMCCKSQGHRVNIKTKTTWKIIVFECQKMSTIWESRLCCLPNISLWTSFCFWFVWSTYTKKLQW